MTLSPYSDENYIGACLAEKQSNVLQALQTPSLILKDGRTSKIWRCTETDLVVKQFKARNKSSLLARIRTSRAERAAKNAFNLIDNGFLTPTVFAYFRDQSDLGCSYLVTATMTGLPLEESLFSKTLDPKVVIQWLARLHNAEIFHRDLKRSNIYINGDQVGVLDLDSLKVKPFWPFEAAGKDLGMLLSSAGAFFTDSELQGLARSYQEARKLSDENRERIVRHAISVAKRRFKRGSAPKEGGWPRA
ncbi:MAG: phosphotransferase [Planctomycetota bacterium]|nr:phosphotransferase [Planctomycetota bacterium]